MDKREKDFPQHPQTLLATAAAEVVLTEDVPGAALGKRQPDELKVPELKRWLACRDASRTGLKPQLVQRVKEYQRSGFAKRVIDPDKGANLDVKRRRLGLVPGSCNLPPLAPAEGWVPGLVGIPDLKYCQVYNYLVASKAITADGGEMGAMKSLKAVLQRGVCPGLEGECPTLELCIYSISNASFHEMCPVQS